MRERDVNRPMRPLWSLQEVDREAVLGWIQANAKSIVWSRLLGWKERAGLPQPLSSVEAGCGYGKMSMLLALTGHRVTLLDYNPDVIAAARQAHGLIGSRPETQVGDLLDLPEGLDGRFDLVCSFGTLEHFAGADRERAFRANARLARPGGLLFFVVPNRFGVFYRIGFGLRKLFGAVEREFYERPWSIGEMSRIARRCGVTPLECDGVGRLGTDFAYWIGENVKSALRKVCRIPRRSSRTDTGPPELADIDLAGRNPDRRTWLDRRFSSGLVFVGRTEGQPAPP